MLRQEQQPPPQPQSCVARRWNGSQRRRRHGMYVGALAHARAAFDGTKSRFECRLANTAPLSSSFTAHHGTINNIEYTVKAIGRRGGSSSRGDDEREQGEHGGSGAGGERRGRLEYGVHSPIGMSRETIRTASSDRPSATAFDPMIPSARPAWRHGHNTRRPPSVLRKSRRLGPLVWDTRTQRKPWTMGISNKHEHFPGGAVSPPSVARERHPTADPRRHAHRRRLHLVEGRRVLGMIGEGTKKNRKTGGRTVAAVAAQRVFSRRFDVHRGHLGDKHCNVGHRTLCGWPRVAVSQGQTKT